MGNRRIAMGLCAAAMLLLASGCRSREVEKDLKLTDVQTGWYDVGVVDGQNKLVPSVTFRIQNVSQEPIENVQINAVFRRVNEAEAWGDRLVRGVGDDGLAAGATGRALVVRSERGYTVHRHRAPAADAEEQQFRRHQGRAVRQARLAHLGEDGGVPDRSRSDH
jgi:hypothetical protein